MNSVLDTVKSSREQLFEELRDALRIEERDLSFHPNEGAILSYNDGVAVVRGLENARLGQQIEVESKPGKFLRGVVFDLSTNAVSCLILDPDRDITPNDPVRTLQAKHEGVSVDVGDHLLSTTLPYVITPLGQSLWKNQHIGRGEISLPIERAAPGLLERDFVIRPIQTGNPVIDKSYPLHRGQRMLLIGDQGSGKTSLALNIVRRACEDPASRFVYVAIGKQASSVRALQHQLTGLGNKGVIVATTPNDPASMHYIAPFAACSIAEYWRDHQSDVVVVYDDLSQHAAAYRQITLLMNHSPGREAYPGDVFYLHSRLLERSAQMFVAPQEISSEFERQLLRDYGRREIRGGSLTAIPIIETIDGDLGYIPTNVISITDGQLFLKRDLKYSDGGSPIDRELSVSRIGRAST